MAKAKKLPSGSWNIVAYDYTDSSGKRVCRSITAPTKAEAEYEYALFKKDKKSRVKTPDNPSVGEIVDKYISLCDVLSPTTISSYKKIREYAFPTLMEKPLSVLTKDIVQEAINDECKRIGRTGKPLSPKTIKNEWTLIASALRSKDISFNVRLPKRVKTIEDLPGPDEVYQAVKDSSILLPCMLAMRCSLRMSEIRGLEYKSIKNGQLYITQVKVDVDNEEVLKPYAKTDLSIRRVDIPDYVMELIKETDAWKNKSGFIVPMTRNQIYHHFTRLTKDLGISFHDLRHIYASTLLNILNIPIKIVQLDGGWSNQGVLTDVYSQGISTAKADANKVVDAFFKTFIQNEGSNALKFQ